MALWKDFRAFIAKGNVLDLAVGVIIGTAFSGITKSLTDDLIMPAAGWVFGGADFSNHFIRLGPIPADYAGSLQNYTALKAAGVPLLGYGQFVSVVINFLFLAFAVFLLVRYLKRAIRLVIEEEAKGTAPDPAPEPQNIVLLREIRDELRADRANRTE